MQLYKCMVAILTFLVWVLPANAGDIADVLLESIPNGLDGWSLQTGSKDIDGSGVKGFGMYSLPAEERLFVIEIDAGGQIVATNAAGWAAQMLIADVVEIGGVKYQVGPDALTGLIDGKILIRAYGPDADERETIEAHLDGLDVEALNALAGRLP